MNLSQCSNRHSRNVALGQFLPRHLTERAAALPHKAAAPTVRHRGSYGPKAAPHSLHRGNRMSSRALQVRWRSIELAANELAKSQARCNDQTGTPRGVLGRARGVIAKA